MRTIDAAAHMQCPLCGARVRGDPESFRQEVRCPGCNQFAVFQKAVPHRPGTTPTESGKKATTPASTSSGRIRSAALVAALLIIAVGAAVLLQTRTQLAARERSARTRERELQVADALAEARLDAIGTSGDPDTRIASIRTLLSELSGRPVSPAVRARIHAALFAALDERQVRREREWSRQRREADAILLEAKATQAKTRDLEDRLQRRAELIAVRQRTLEADRAKLARRIESENAQWQEERARLRRMQETIDQRLAGLERREERAAAREATLQQRQRQIDRAIVEVEAERASIDRTRATAVEPKVVVVRQPAAPATFMHIEREVVRPVYIPLRTRPVRRRFYEPLDGWSFRWRYRSEDEDVDLTRIRVRR